MPQIAASVPRGVEASTMVRFLFNAINADPDLVTKCTPSSIADCLVRAASRGLEISDGMLGDCHLVPFGNECVLILGYKGIKKLVRNSGQGIVVMDHVREGDTFQERGPMAAPHHVKSQDPNRNEKPITHSYAVMQFRSGLCVSKVMTIAETLAHRNEYVAKANYRDAGKQWHEKNVAFPRMCEKTCVRQLAGAGDLPLSADDKTLLASDVETIGVTDYQQAEVPPTPQIEYEAQTNREHVASVAAACETPMQCDKAKAELMEQFPGSKQLIFDVLEARREQLCEST